MLPINLRKRIIWGIGIFLILFLIGVGVYKFYCSHGKNDLEVKNTEEAASTQPADSSIDNPTADQYVLTGTGADWIGKYDAYGDLRDYTSSYPSNDKGDGDLQISWYKQAVKLSDNELNKIYHDFQIASGEKLQIFVVGKISAPQNLAGHSVYYIYMESAKIFNFAFIDEIRNKFIVLSLVSNYGMCSSWKDCGNITGSYFGGVIDGLNFKDLESPELINVPEMNFKLVPTGARVLGEGENREDDIVRTGGIHIGYNNNLISIKPLPDTTSRLDTSVGELFLENGCYRYIRTDGSYQNYEMLPYFLSYNGPEMLSGKGNMPYDAEITWLLDKNTKKLTITGYDLENGLGCGQAYNSCTNIVNGQSWFDEQKLVLVGKTKNGDGIFELSDKATNPYYRKQFENSGNYDPDFNYDYSNTSTDYLAAVKKTEEKMWKIFIDGISVVFWKDNFGNWRAYRDAKFAPMAECGKPVIYLYPQKDTNVNVKVAPNGGLTKVDPAYPSDGWNVHATPQSELTNLADGQQYPYLFWEGKAYNMITPDYGFVMSRAEVGEKMKIILAKLGLNEKETADFLEFWQSKLEVSPYVFVTFVPQSEFDKMAPLTVSPRPDKVIRVFMDYAPLDAPVFVRAPQITTPTRTGFTVVEWGGRLHQ